MTKEYVLFMHEEECAKVPTHEEVETSVRLVSVEVAQHMLGDLSYRQIGLMRDRGDLRGMKIGKRALIELASINEYIDRKLQESRESVPA